jgi:hypothetical protein
MFSSFFPSKFLRPTNGTPGTSHGSGGVLSQLLDVPELLEEGTTSRELIIGTLDHIVSQQFPSGNFPSEYYDESEDELVQWDHGAPGIMTTLAKASVILSDPSYLASAQKAADCVWERGILYKGLMICHGIMGNTYMQSYLYKLTGDLKYLYRAISFQEFVSQTPDLYDINLMRQPTPVPFGFFAASYASAAALWSDLLRRADDDLSKISMPFFEGSI